MDDSGRDEKARGWAVQGNRKFADGYRKEIMNVQIKKFLMCCHIIVLHKILQKRIHKEVRIRGGEPKC